MNKRVWTFQYKREVDAKGDRASWYVGYYDADGSGSLVDPADPDHFIMADPVSEEDSR